MKVIGVTGEIGAGKSTVAGILAEAGARVIDADRVGHEVLQRPEIREAVLRVFGDGVVGEDRRIDRKALGKLVFADDAQRRRLEAIVHPAMRQAFEETIGRLQRENAPMVVLDAALLYEAGWDRLCDVIVFVAAPRPLREARLRASRGWSGAELRRRENAQLPSRDKRGRAGVVIENGGTLQKCRQALEHWRRQWTEPENRPRCYGHDQ